MIQRKFCAAFLLFACSPLMAQGPDSPITVNGIEISEAKVAAQITYQVGQRGGDPGSAVQPEAYQQVRRQVVEQLVAQELLWQEAKRRNFIATDTEVDKQFQRTKSGFDSEQAFISKIQESGFTESSYRDDIRRQLTVEELVTQGVLPSTDISDEEIKAFYDANVDQMKIPEQVHARHILAIPAGSDEAAKQAALEKITGIQKELRDGANFQQLAIERSDGPSAPRGGDLGFFGRGQMVPAFELAAFAMQAGEISDIVETQFGFHIIKLDERQEERFVLLVEAAERIYEYLAQDRLQEAMKKLIAELRARARIENAPVQ